MNIRFDDIDYPVIESGGDQFSLPWLAMTIQGSFRDFQLLPHEIRHLVWKHSFNEQMQILSARLPSSYDPERYIDEDDESGDWFLGYQKYSDTAPRVATLPPTIIVLNDGSRTFVDDDGFARIVNQLKISAICHESRSYAVKRCLALPTQVEYDYNPCGHGYPAAQINRVAYPSNNQILIRAFSQATTLFVYGGNKRFKSTQHMLSMFSRYPTATIRRLVLDLCCEPSLRLRPFWSEVPDGGPELASYIEEDIREFDVAFDVEPQDNTSIMYATPDRLLHVSKETWREKFQDTIYVASYLIRVRDILDISKDIFPNLKQVDLRLQVHRPGSTWKRINTTVENDKIYTNLAEAHLHALPSPWRRVLELYRLTSL